MLKRYSITEARDRFTALLRKVEKSEAVELTRRGKPVAVLMSVEEYRQLQSGRARFWEAFSKFRNNVDLEQLDIRPEIFSDHRDPTPGREVEL